MTSFISVLVLLFAHPHKLEHPQISEDWWVALVVWVANRAGKHQKITFR
jgi:hypothetical protein